MIFSTYFCIYSFAFIVHINSTKTSSMFNRRPRSLIHTCIIVLLVIIVVYVAYLNSNLQVQVKNLDSKSKLYQAQHQSLSSQLQGIHVQMLFFCSCFYIHSLPWYLSCLKAVVEQYIFRKYCRCLFCTFWFLFKEVLYIF